LLCVVVLVAHSARAGGFDCNLNGRDDAEEIAANALADCAGDGMADACDVVELLTGGGPRRLETEGAPSGLASGDFDGDGRTDVATLDRDGGAVIFWTRRGGDELRREAELPVCGTPTSIAAADFDGDGADDLVVGCASDSSVRVVSPVLDRETARVFLDAPPAAVAAGDLDGDGRIDVVAATSDRVSWIRNRADGTLEVVRTLDGTGTDHPGALEVVDVDGDSVADVVVASASRDTLTLAYGAPGLAAGDAVVLDVGDAPVDLVAADLDLDGDQDLVTADQDSGELTVLWQTSSRRFSTARVLWHESEPLRPAALGVGDLNLDGRPDLAVVGTRPDRGDELWVVDTLVGLPNGAGFSYAEGFFVGTSVREGIHAAALIVDLEGEGERDPPEAVAVTPVANEVRVYSVQNEGGGGDDDRNGIPDACEGRVFRRGDVNVDGLFDIADAVGILRRLFLGEAPPTCLGSADVDDSGGIDVTDAIALLNHLFLGAAAPPPPYPGCGVDPTVDGLGCLSFALCP